jgi:hypothetical protein
VGGLAVGDTGHDFSWVEGKPQRDQRRPSRASRQARNSADC